MKNIYIPPIIQGFRLIGDVCLDSFVEVEDARKKINDSLLSYLNIHTEFNKKMYISSLTDLVNKIDGVKFSNLKLQPIVPSIGTDLTPEECIDVSNLGDQDADAVKSVFLNEFSSYEQEPSNINERTFYYDFAKRVYDNTSLLGYNKSINFVTTLSNLIILLKGKN